MSNYKVQKPDAEWRAQLDETQFEVTRHAATERAFTGKYWDHWQAGSYACVCCGEPLFASAAKFDAGCGWPSYSEALKAGIVERVTDRSHGMVRVEVRCQNCGAHLGHVFDDGPQPTGERYCINSASIDFRPEIISPTDQDLMKFFFDLLPIILFFVAFKVAEGNPDAAAAFASQHFGMLVSGGVVGPKEAPVLLATLVVMVATLAQILVLKLMRRKVDTMLWVSLGLVTVLGGATVWFHSETFIKWKPSVLYWVMGCGLWISQAFFGKNLLQSLMGAQLTLPPSVWRTLNFMWIAFFAFMGLLNLYVAYAFSTDTWVNFKLFGGVGLMLVFTLAQGWYLSRHLKPEDE